MTQFLTFSVAGVRQFGSSHAFYLPELQSILTKRLHILPRARMLRPNNDRVNQTSASINTNPETEVAKGLGKEHGISHQQRTATDPRQSAIHDVILSKVETTYQDIRLFRLRPTTSLFYHGADGEKRSEGIHASHSFNLRSTLS